MVDEVELIDATREQILLWLKELVVLAAEELRKNPLRRPAEAPRLVAARLDPYQLPLYLRAHGRRVFGIYDGRQAEGTPYVPLLVRVSVAQSAPRTLRVELECTEGFPMTQREVLWHLLQRFPSHETKDASADRRAALDDWPDDTAQGAPVLSCNSWLEEQLARGASEEERRALYRPWLERYRALRNRYPADPRRSYRAAVAGCLQRLAAQGRPIPHERLRRGRPKGPE